MNQIITTVNQFSFHSQKLPQHLIEHIQSGTTGYWEHQFERPTLNNQRKLPDLPQILNWHVGITNGRILYSGHRIWSAQSLLRVVERYVFNTRHNLVKPRFDLIKIEAEDKGLTPAQLLTKMVQARILDESQMAKALRTKILNDLDIYLLSGDGVAKFIPDPDLTTQLPLTGFDPVNLLDEAARRQSMWEMLKPQVPSMSLVPILDQEMMAKSQIPIGQQQRIESLVKFGSSLNSIASGMARDPLEIADMFAKLVRVGVIRFASSTPTQPKTIMAIDDSPVMLTQFEKLVSALGYSVAICQEADLAIDTIIKVNPAAIFIDLNMPGMSGFELIKQIRQQPQLATIPLAILTGEQKLSNRWRAQWSGCEFLSKPLTPGAVREFQTQLEELLPRLLKSAATASTDALVTH